MEQKTPLYDIHIKYGGKMVPYSGFMMPVQYAGIVKEHNAVREKVGIFDVSHMGEFSLTGPDSLAFLQNLLTNDMSTMKPNQVRYTPMCNEQGGCVDDLLVYKMDDEKYMLVVNASNTAKDFDWMTKHLSGNCQLVDNSASTALIALQGPKTKDIMEKLGVQNLPEKYYFFTENVNIGGVNLLASRTGYTGEFGYEFYLNLEDAPKLWEALMEAGKEYDITPCGLGSRDTLRLEAGMPLYGHEMDDNISPLEAGLGMFVKMNKDTFIGKDAIVAAGDPKRQRIGIELMDKGIARDESKLFDGDKEIGYITSGTLCPYINKSVGNALVVVGDYPVGKELIVDVRGRKLKAAVCAVPFYSKK